jgi:hypothetical protein
VSHRWDRDPWYDEIWLDRFWRRVDRSAGPDGCWPWTRSTNDGYGIVKRRGRTVLAHRVACELSHGTAPADKPLACHSIRCTTRACCNGSHLRWDTHAGNQRDVVTLGSRKGEKHWLARITSAQAAEVWSRRGQRPCDVARDLGVSPYVASQIMRGKTWRHVTGAVAASILLAGTGPEAKS